MTRALATIVAALAVLAAGLYLGGHPDRLPEPVRDVFVDENTDAQATAIDLIKDNYAREVSDQRLQNGSIRGMVDSLSDRFSQYFTPRERKVFEQGIGGEFGGVGMVVVEHRRGLLITGVYENTPAEKAKIKPGDIITAVNRKSIAGESSDLATARIKGKPGTSVTLTVRQGTRGKPRVLRVERAQITIPVAEGKLRRVGGRKLGVATLATFSNGAHGQLETRLQSLLERKVEGFVIDLRHNGGGLLNEAVLVSSLFVPDGVIVSTKGRKRARQVLQSNWRRDQTQAAGGAGRPSHGQRIRDRDRCPQRTPRREDRRSPDVRKGSVRTGVQPAQRRRARPYARQLLHARGPQPRREGHRAGCPRRRQSTHAQGRGARAGASSAGRRGPRHARRLMPAQTVSDSFVGVIARRGRFLVAEPLFERGRRVTLDVRGRSEVPIGEMALIAERVAEGAARIVRALGRPDRARDVVEALLVERGHARRFSESLEEKAREASLVKDARRRRDLTSLATFTIDPVEARDFDDAISAERQGDGCRIYVHIADVAAHVEQGSVIDHEALRRGNSVYVPGAVEPMLPEALSSDACSLVPGKPRRTVTVEMVLNAGAEVVSASFERSLIRSDARLSYDEVEQIFSGGGEAPEQIAEPLDAGTRCRPSSEGSPSVTWRAWCRDRRARVRVRHRRECRARDR